MQYRHTVCKSSQFSLAKFMFLINTWLLPPDFLGSHRKNQSVFF